MRVNEIFYSLQGEGFYTGTAAIFVRFSGCNLRCPFCDTRHATFKDYTAEEIFCEISAYPSKHIVFTGGEPSLQLTTETVRFFKEKGYYIQVETKGTMKLPITVDWVTCSPKNEYCPDAEIVLEKINELKVVFDGKVEVAHYLDLKAEVYCLQPCDVGDEQENKRIAKTCVEYVQAHPQWRLSLQMHKIVGIR